MRKKIESNNEFINQLKMLGVSSYQVKSTDYYITQIVDKEKSMRLMGLAHCSDGFIFEMEYTNIEYKEDRFKNKYFVATQISSDSFFGSTLQKCWIFSVKERCIITCNGVDIKLSESGLLIALDKSTNKKALLTVNKELLLRAEYDEIYDSGFGLLTGVAGHRHDFFECIGNSLHKSISMPLDDRYKALINYESFGTYMLCRIAGRENILACKKNGLIPITLNATNVDLVTYAKEGLGLFLPVGHSSVHFLNKYGDHLGDASSFLTKLTVTPYYIKGTVPIGYGSLSGKEIKVNRDGIDILG